MSFRTYGDFATSEVDSSGLRVLSAGTILTAALLYGLEKDNRGAAAYVFPGGVVQGGQCTASGLTVSVPAQTVCLVNGALWIATAAVPVLVPDNATTWLWFCADGVIRQTTSFGYPTGFGGRTSFVLCRAVASAGAATVDLEVQQRTVFAEPRLFWLPFALQFGRRVITVGDANITLEAWQRDGIFLDFAGTLTAQRVVTLPLGSGRAYRVYNGTSGGFGLEFRGATGTGVVVAAGKRAWIESDGENWYRTTPDV